MEQTHLIMHVDMDAFFASVEERNNPRLKGLPVVVGSDPKQGHGRGVVSTANYKARVYGIHSALPITKAWHLSEQAYRNGIGPRAVFVSSHFSNYGKTSRRIMDILRMFSPLIQVSSVDEAYIQVNVKSYEQAEKVAENIRETIWKKEHLTCSIGIGPNKLIAKIASGFKKPDGLTLVKPSDVQKFLSPQPIRVIPGIGPKTQEFFAAKGVTMIYQLQTIPKHSLQEWLGKWGEAIYAKSHGIGSRTLNNDRKRKSLGHQETFSTDTLKTSLLIKQLRQLTKKTVQGLRKEQLTCRTVEVVVRFADFETKTRSKSFPTQTDDYDTIWERALGLFVPFLDERQNPQKKLIRLIGISLGKIETLTKNS